MGAASTDAFKNSESLDAECKDDITSQSEPSIYENLLSLDYLQENISHKLYVFSSNLDYALAAWIAEDNVTTTKRLNASIDKEKAAYSFFSVVDWYDDFFKDESYLSTTNNSYVRLRVGFEQNNELGFSGLNNIRMSLRLPKTEKALYFFVGDDADEDKKTLNNEEDATSVGLKYFIKGYEVLNANVFGGFRGVQNPFIKLRMVYPVVYDRLLFRPIQYFEYSAEDEFKEETLLYIDHLLASKKDLIRLLLSRSTQTHVEGMNYFAQFSYLNTIKHGVGIQLYTNLSGRTGLDSTTPANTKYNVTPTIGVYDYSSGIIWKQQFIKKYLFYQIQPVVQFAQEYNYNANYIFRANIELYFGDI